MTAARSVLLVAVLLTPTSWVAAEPSTDPVADAIAGILAQSRTEDPAGADRKDLIADIRRFYEERGHTAAWSSGGLPTRQAVTIAAVLAGAADKGLDPADYRVPVLGPTPSSGLVQLPPSAEDLARFDVDATAAVMRYASDLLRGRVDPKRLGLALEAAPEACDLSALTASLTEERDPGAALEAMEPQFRHYRRLREALGRYRALARRFEGWVPLAAPPKPVREGTPYEDSQRLADLLVALGDLTPPSGEEPPAVLTPAIAGALQRFQDRHGLEPDGVLGPETLAELNTPLSRRVRQIELTLERWRWMPRDLRERLIVVNVPEFRLRAFEPAETGLRLALEMRVILGKDYPRNQTPLFARTVRYVVFNPYWEVPASIAREELVPKLRADPKLFQAQGYVIESPSGPRAFSPESLELVEAGKARIRQRPGGKNPLGPVKFMFPNEYNVYLHGTPFPALFERARRAFSHGCIRVEDPLALAGFVLRQEDGWDQARIREAAEGDKPLHVAVPQGPRVLLVYATAVAEEDGTVRFLTDLYGHDAELERALAGRQAQGR